MAKRAPYWGPRVPFTLISLITKEQAALRRCGGRPPGARKPARGNTHAGTGARAPISDRLASPSTAALVLAIMAPVGAAEAAGGARRRELEARLRQDGVDAAQKGARGMTPAIH